MPRIKERRRRKRVDVALAIKIEYNNKKVFAKTKNISVLGTFIETDKKIPTGVSLNIGIRIPQTGFKKSGASRQINCAGVAFRRQPVFPEEIKKQYGIGIFFRSFFAEGEKKLSKYIDYILLQEQELGKIYIRKRKQRRLKRKGEQ